MKKRNIMTARCDALPNYLEQEMRDSESNLNSFTKYLTHNSNH